MASFGDSLKNKYHYGDMAVKFIFINTAVFLALKLIVVFAALFRMDGQVVVQYLQQPADWETLIKRPWTLFTYMFVHEGFLHLLFNMIWLYFFGRLFLKYFDVRQYLWVYILGGICGGLFYAVGYNIFPLYQNVVASSLLTGASASILALTLAVALYYPDEKLNLMFLGTLQLKWFAVIMIVIDILSLTGGNAGGSLAHLGGAFFGAVYGYVSKIRNRGSFRFSSDSGSGRTSGKKGFWRRFFGQGAVFSGGKGQRRRKCHHSRYERTNRPVHESEQAYRDRKKQEEDRRDAILDKIKMSGYESLTEEEKEFLFRQSKK